MIFSTTKQTAGQMIVRKYCADILVDGINISKRLPENPKYVILTGERLSSIQNKKRIALTLGSLNPYQHNIVLNQWDSNAGDSDHIISTPKRDYIELLFGCNQTRYDLCIASQN